MPMDPGMHDSEMRVSELIDFEEGRWDTELVNSTFSVDVRTLNLSIPLFNSWPVDSRFWWPNSNGIFSVKSAYWLGRMGLEQVWGNNHGQLQREVWKMVWNLGTPPKLSHFIWRACKGSLAVRERLYFRRIIDQPTCNVCGGANETIIHALFHCKYAQLIWFDNLLNDAPSSSVAELLMWVVGRVTKDELRVFVALGLRGDAEIYPFLNNRMLSVWLQAL